MKFSLLICTYNRDKYIFETLNHIASNAFDFGKYELVIVDNNCTDNTSAECHRFQIEHPDINFSYVVETQQGLSYARNRAIAEAKGDFLVFLDADAYVEKDSFQNLDSMLKQ